jgi:hypothetical protein
VSAGSDERADGQPGKRAAQLAAAQLDTAPWGTAQPKALPWQAVQLEVLQREFPRYRFETQQFGGQQHYTATRRAGARDARPYSVTTDDLSRLRRELAAGRTPGSM